ncbi:autotransporter outer membrane beta-barrel domain-containing protein [Sandarakinorhabdus sp.]|uniref:autotransporter outer membrane beta-barrel domain-containing protein n=1 Tax=Sandarakinorhabdus sp. TaxID=1916663 RepID=UPI0033410BDD
MAAGAALAGASPAAAQDVAQDGAQDGAERERPWTLSLSGGLTAVQAQADQPFAALGLTRNFGTSWVKADVTYVGSGNARGLTIPADTWIGGLAAGTYVGNLGLEAHVSLGRRQFDAANLRSQAGTAIAVDRSGGIFGLGGSISYDVMLADRLFITPYAGIDYNQIDFAVALTGPGGRVISSQQQSSDGVIGSAGAALTRMFAGDGGSISLSGTINTASNIAAVGQVGAGQRTTAGTPRFVDALRQSGSWGELAATLSFNASAAVAIDLSVIRTVSFPFGDTTAGIAGLRFRF